jgi:hypothetical protein
MISHVMIEPLTMSFRLADNNSSKLPAIVAIYMTEALWWYRIFDLVLNFFLFFRYWF